MLSPLPAETSSAVGGGAGDLARAEDARQPDLAAEGEAEQVGAVVTGRR